MIPPNLFLVLQDCFVYSGHSVFQCVLEHIWKHIWNITSFLSSYLPFFFMLPKPWGVEARGDGAQLVGKADVIDHPHKCNILGKVRLASRDRDDLGIMCVWLTQLLIISWLPLGSEIP